ncbi:MAG: hypothetical protein LBB45_00265, partial [Methanobrevibacter sp.]|nr:hypothetical protein [Candidatus Methanovirga basalitermitum]
MFDDENNFESESEEELNGGLINDSFFISLEQHHFEMIVNGPTIDEEYWQKMIEKMIIESPPVKKRK